MHHVKELACDFCDVLRVRTGPRLPQSLRENRPYRISLDLMLEQIECLARGTDTIRKIAFVRLNLEHIQQRQMQERLFAFDVAIERSRREIAFPRDVGHLRQPIAPLAEDGRGALRDPMQAPRWFPSHVTTSVRAA